MTNQQHSYEDFREVSETLADGLRRLASGWDELGPLGAEDAVGRGDRLRAMAEHMLGSSFNLMIVGEFKRGKSTLINAMLGKQLLPAKVAPCTAVITQVHYGEREVARLYFQDPQREPLEVPAAELKKYVVIDDVAAERGSARSTEYSRMEVHAPLALCRNGVMLTDSPGLNEHETRTDVSLRFLTEADALLLVLSCEQALSSSERSFITDTLAQYGHDLRNVFVVWNRYEVVRDSEDDERDIRARSRTFLEPVVGGAARVFYVSALEALKGRHNNNPELIERSGLPTLERALEVFLTSERAAVKLRNPLGAATASLRELESALERRRLLLQADLAPLQQRYDAARPKLEKLAKDREKIRRKIEAARDELGERLVESYHSFVATLRPSLLAVLEKEQVSFTDIITKKKELGERLQAILSQEMLRQLEQWNRGTVSPVVERTMRGLQDALYEGVAEYVRDLEGLRDNIIGGVPVTRAKEDDESIFGRVLAAAGGLALGGVGGAVMGGAMGFKRMLAGMGVHLALIIGAIIFGLNPVGMLVLSLLSGFGITAAQGGTMVRELKERVVNEFQEGLQTSSPEVDTRLKGEVASKLDELRDKVDGELKLMMDEVHGQVEAALHDLTARREDVDRRVMKLLAVKSGLEPLQAQLDRVRAYAGG